jgi:uncharacterized protein YjeT (DUF2065 family)
MKRTHYSPYYLIGYLIPGGLALLLAPQLALKLMFSSGQYGDVLPRVVGMLMVALGIFVMQAVRDKTGSAISHCAYSAKWDAARSCSGYISTPAIRYLSHY